VATLAENPARLIRFSTHLGRLEILTHFVPRATSGQPKGGLRVNFVIQALLASIAMSETSARMQRIRETVALDDHG
jgi:hypothetical protein